MQTLYTTLVGFGLGIVFGVLHRRLRRSSRLAYDVAYPLLIGFSSIPKVAIVPILVLWFGAGTVPAIITALSLPIFPIVVNVATGLATTEPELEDVMRAMKATASSTSSATSGCRAPCRISSPRSRSPSRKPSSAP